MQTDFNEAKSFFSQFYLGEHHIPKSGIKSFGEGWYVNHYGELSTFDFDNLTRLVFLAHDMCFRISVMNSGPGMIKIVIWKRDGREGKIWQRHPTIETALTGWRRNHEH
jgi:hypothetical protein